MTCINTPKIITFMGVLITLQLSACGGGGGSSDSSGGSTPGTITKSQTSAPSNESSSQQNTFSVANSSASSVTSAGEITPNKPSTSSAPKPSISSSSSSKSSSAKATIDVIAPDMVPDISVVLTEHDVAVFSWTAATDNVGVTTYKIYRNQIQIDQIDAIDLIYVDFNVAPASTYTYSISAGDAVGNWSPIKTVMTKTLPTPSSSESSLSSKGSSSSSKSSSSITNNSGSSSSANALDLTAPSAPSSISQILASATTVDIGWTPATDNIAVTAYKIYRDNILLDTVEADALKYSDKTTAPDTTYAYSVESGDAAGNWSLVRTTTLITTPSAASVGDVTLYWAPPTQRNDGSTIIMAELGGFIIKYKSKADTSYTFIDITDSSTKSHIIHNISTDYDIQIAAYDSDNLYSSFVDILPR